MPGGDPRADLHQPALDALNSPPLPSSWAIARSTSAQPPLGEEGGGQHGPGPGWIPVSLTTAVITAGKEPLNGRGAGGNSGRDGLRGEKGFTASAFQRQMEGRKAGDQFSGRDHRKEGLVTSAREGARGMELLNLFLLLGHCS